MKKILLALTAVGAIAIPVGVATAQDDDTDTTDDTATETTVDETTVDETTDPDWDGPVRDRDRINEQDPASERGQARYEYHRYLDDEMGFGEIVRARIQERLSALAGNQAGEGEGEMVRTRAQVRVEDPDAVESGEGEMVRTRAQVRVEDPDAVEPGDDTAPVVGDQDRDRDRLQDGSCDGDCGDQIQDQDCLQDGAGEMQRRGGR